MTLECIERRLKEFRKNSVTWYSCSLYDILRTVGNKHFVYHPNQRAVKQPTAGSARAGLRYKFQRTDLRSSSAIRKRDCLPLSSCTVTIDNWIVWGSWYLRNHNLITFICLHALSGWTLRNCCTSNGHNTRVFFIALSKDYTLNEVGTKLMHLREFPRQSLAAFVKGNQGVNLGILVLFLWASLLPLVSIKISIFCFARSLNLFLLCSSFRWLYSNRVAW